MDIAVVGFGPAALYLSSRLAAEGFEVSLFGSMPELLPEFVSQEAVKEFSLQSFSITPIKRIARFDRNFELREKFTEGAVIDSNGLLRYLLLRAAKYGVEIVAGSVVEIGERIKLKWLEKSFEIEPEFIIMEESCGRSVYGAEVARIPTNPDTVEYYEAMNMLILPSGETATVYGNLDFSWHKFENVAVLNVKELFVPPERNLMEKNLIRVGRAAGHTSEFGWLIEEGLYYGRLLTECLLRYFDGEEGALEIYRRRGRQKYIKKF